MSIGDKHHPQKVMVILLSMLELMGYSTSCVGINVGVGDNPRGLRHPWCIPSVDPSTLVRNIPILHSPPSSIVTKQKKAPGLKGQQLFKKGLVIHFVKVTIAYFGCMAAAVQYRVQPQPNEQ